MGRVGSQDGGDEGAPMGRGRVLIQEGPVCHLESKE